MNEGMIKEILNLPISLKEDTIIIRLSEDSKNELAKKIAEAHQKTIGVIFEEIEKKARNWDGITLNEQFAGREDGTRMITIEMTVVRWEAIKAGAK